MTALLSGVGERFQLLTAIKKNPAELTPRLAYADWLDEHAEGDLDTATAEFIRVSCKDRVRSAMPAAAYWWIDDNWPRLLPSVLVAHRPTMDRLPIRFGRQVWFRFRGTDVDDVTGERTPWPSARTVLFFFSRGFVDTVRIYSGPAADLLRPLIRQDQPLARIVGGSNP